MTSKLTRLTDEELAELAFYAGESTCHPDPNYWLEFEKLARPGAVLNLVEELQEHRKAAMDSEPVVKNVACWSCQNEVEISAIGDCDGYCPKCDAPIDLDEEPYTSPQPAPDREQVRSEHAEWSQATFGNVGPVGPLRHLSKEALEAAAEPGDLSEWADIQFLMWDAQRRAGITDEQITQAMIEKLAVNKLREWPEPKDGEPRLHIKAQPAPVVPEALQSLRTIVADPRRLPRRKEWIGGQQYSFVLLEEVEAIVEDACRAAMLQAGNSPVIGIDPASGPDRTVEVRYVAPPGYVMVPKQPTEEMLAAAKEWTGLTSTAEVVYVKMLAAAPQEVK